MISFVTVSKDKSKFDGLRSNLEGIFQSHPGFEFIVCDGTEHDIFTGYNAGAAEAKNEVLAFLHDDVRLWCSASVFEKPMELLKKPFTGFIGAAGTRMLPKDGCWWKSPEKSTRGMVAHPDENEFGVHWNVWPHQAAQFGEVAICDGVFLLCHRRTFDRLGGFDAETYKGFHLYDIDITLRARLEGLVNYVAPIPLFHNSVGRTNDNWEENRKIFARKFEKYLPYNLD